METHLEKPSLEGWTETSYGRKYSQVNFGNDTQRTPRKLVLCFDGTGNKFHGNDGDSNILKIFRMLDRTANDQYHYYQPGIGTYVTSTALSYGGLYTRISSWYKKAKDSAIGSSFDQHVVGGYRFLMRFYNPGDEIYMFGFSRGAYIARFLAEMIDHIGLLSHGNEEMVKFAWKAFAQWQCRRGGKEQHDTGHDEDTQQMYRFMKGFRETFSRPVGRIRFLGLFDTVNSVPKFENAWMQRSKFPYTARSSAAVIRHAVSIDERRAKFRQDLLYQEKPHRHHHVHLHVDHMLSAIRRSMDMSSHEPPVPDHSPDAVTSTDVAGQNGKTHDKSLLSPDDDPTAQASRGRQTLKLQGRQSTYAPYRPRSRSRQSCHQSFDDASMTSAAPDMDNETKQDIDEVWFSGGHGDVGGGWNVPVDGKSASHVPLVWMVREAIKAGLNFDMQKVYEMGCAESVEPSMGTEVDSGMNKLKRPSIQVQETGNGVPHTLTMDSDVSPEEPKSVFHKLMHQAHTSDLHDSLEFGGGLGNLAVTAWTLMEWLPFRRMDLQMDGSWKPIRWPLPRGEVRDIPANVRVHGSVIRRLKLDENYRPGNLIIGGGGRGVRKASEEHGIGDWVCVAEPGDAVGEIWTKK